MGQEDFSDNKVNRDVQYYVCTTSEGGENCSKREGEITSKITGTRTYFKETTMKTRAERREWNKFF